MANFDPMEVEVEYSYTDGVVDMIMGHTITGTIKKIKRKYLIHGNDYRFYKLDANEELIALEGQELIDLQTSIADEEQYWIDEKTLTQGLNETILGNEGVLLVFQYLQAKAYVDKKNIDEVEIPLLTVIRDKTGESLDIISQNIIDEVMALSNSIGVLVKKKKEVKDKRDANKLKEK